MSNEELISQSPFGNKSCSCGKIYTNRNLVAPDCIACNYADDVRELMDAARKDEAIRFGNLLKKFASIEGVKRELLWWDKMTGGTFYTTEQLYEQFKKDK